MRTGPTGTPFTATYQSLPCESSDMSNGAETSSSRSRCTLVLKAPASALGSRSGFGAAGRCAVRLAARGVARGGNALDGGLTGDGGGVSVGGTGEGSALAMLDSITAARISMR